MAARAIGSGTISFGLVAIPVKLFSTADTIDQRVNEKFEPARYTDQVRSRMMEKIQPAARATKKPAAKKKATRSK